MYAVSLSWELSRPTWKLPAYLPTHWVAPSPFPHNNNPRSAITIMGGILKNEKEGHKVDAETAEFDRSQVLKNTELNSQLGHEGEKLRESIRLQNETHQENEGHKAYPKTKAPQALRQGELAEDEGFADVEFDERGISDWDKQRGQTEKITEPNTPYMGTAADTEYYDDDPVPEDIDLGGSA